MAALMSMTGFAREAGTLADGAAWAWELRSVNGRGLDLRLRLPPSLEALDVPLRALAAARLKRGNVGATLTVKRDETRARLQPDPAALEAALRLATELAARIPRCPPPRAEALLALPGVLRTTAPEPEEGADRAVHDALLAGFSRALDALVAARAAEGAALSRILHALLDEIAALHAEATADAAAQPAALRDRLAASVGALLADPARVPPDRLAAEVALLASRADVREELDRLGAHLDAARALLAEGEAVGRKLEFLTQEFGREANTLGAKSASIGLTRGSLALKAAIERLREQAANVE